MIGALAAAMGSIVVAGAATAPAALAAPSPPFTQCPNVYLDTGCQYLIDVTSPAGAAGPQTTVYLDPNQPLIDGSEDTLVGVQNDSGTALSRLYIGVSGSGDNDFGFDGDGLCNASAPIPAGCPFGPTGYEGPGTTFTATTSDDGYVTFSPPVAANGGKAYFSLEGSPGSPVVAGTSPQNVAVSTTLSDGTNTSSGCTTGIGCGELDEAKPTQVSDQATLTGPNTATASGSITYAIYTDSACQTLAGAAYSETLPIPSSHAVPPSDAKLNTAALPTGHTYYWKASYSGDQNGNAASASACGSELMVFGTSAVTPSVSGGGTQGTAITVPAGTPVTATATIGNAKATGYVYYSYYSDSACSALVTTAGDAPVKAGAGGASTPATLPGGSTYYLQIRYTGDGNDAAATSCAKASVTVLAPPTPTITPSVSGGGAQGSSISVPLNTPVTVTAQLSGTNTAATGSVEYDFYTDSQCTAFYDTGGSGAVTNGSAAPSLPVTFTAPGTYYLLVYYSGDASNAPTTSSCGQVTVDVAGAAASSGATATPAGSTSSSSHTTATTTTATGGVLGASTVTLPPPTIYKDVNVYPVSGTVYIKLPPGATLSRVHGPLASESATKGIGFIPLTQARQIPVGSVLDTTGGTVAITAASPTKGKLYTGDFTAGVFQLLQNRKQQGLAELDLHDTLNRRTACASLGKGARASAAKKVSNKVLGLLKSTDNGKFSTHGTYSSATVRGTAYSVADTCAGTLTTVTRGSVAVDYFRRHKTIIVKAGHAFLAKASGGPSVVVTIGKKADATLAAFTL